MSRNEVITFSSAINEAISEAMAQDDSVICYGLGVTDPKAVFGTTTGLKARFGKRRVFDMPTSENAMTGVAIGAALGGLRPVMTHQRLDFFLLALDQLVNAAAKWHYMFGSQQSVPITIRLIVGRGWGQGPTHSQNLQAWFAHIPGLKVILPTTADDAKGLLIDAIFDPNPVLFIEHRWLYSSVAPVPAGLYRVPLGKARTIRPGTDLTIISFSYMTIEAGYAVDLLRQQFGINAELIDLRSVRPIDWATVLESISRTGRLLALDTGVATISIASEIIARATMECFERLRCAPRRLAMPEVPEPTSFSLTRDFYPSTRRIVTEALQLMGQCDVVDTSINIPDRVPHDIPGDWFRGPF